VTYGEGYFKINKLLSSFRLFGMSDVSQHVKVGWFQYFSTMIPAEFLFFRKIFGKRLFGDSSVTSAFCRFFVFTIQRTVHPDSALFLRGCKMATFESFCGVSEGEII